MFDIDIAGANTALFGVTQGSAVAVTPTTSTARAPASGTYAHVLLRTRCEMHSLRTLDDCCRLAAAVYAAPAPLNRAAPYTSERTAVNRERHGERDGFAMDSGW
jgi:hypothetical protein